MSFLLAEMHVLFCVGALEKIQNVLHLKYKNEASKHPFILSSSVQALPNNGVNSCHSDDAYTYRDPEPKKHNMNTNQRGAVGAVELWFRPSVKAPLFIYVCMYLYDNV